MDKRHWQPIVIIMLLAGFAFFSCKKADIQICDSANHSLHKTFNFPVGVAVDIHALRNDADYTNLVQTQFNSVTAENIFKPVYLHPGPDQFFFEEADELVDYCLQHEKRLHGHTLLWHNQIPGWMELFKGTEAAWDSLLKVHIQTIVKHFKGKVSSWDVVNEAFEDDGSLRNTIWKQNLGESYIEKAFRYAHEADSSALLFYNDYSLAGKSKKRMAVIDFLGALKDKGVPIHGIGLQMHISIGYPGNSKIADAINQIWENDYLVHLSELDISINPDGKNMATPPSGKLTRQAEKAAFIFESYQQIPMEYQFGISFWGVSDRYTWIRGFFGRDDFPLLFDDDHQPKPVYCRLVDR